MSKKLEFSIVQSESRLGSGETVKIEGGRVTVGTNRPYLTLDGEGPERLVRVNPFMLAVSAVTNEEFAAFVAETGYVTEAERLGWSYVFYQFLNGDFPTSGVVGAEWWRRVDGANWASPCGPGSSIEGIQKMPVVHVSWQDAVDYCRWVGGRLPSEAEWEHAARGGRSRALYPWGNEHPSDQFTPCNIWQGTFPNYNSAADGYRGLAPSVSFEPNGYGLYNMAGNCWEWTSDIFRVRSLRKASKSLNSSARQEEKKVLKGGSYLCHASYCHRYRIAARMGSTGDSTTGHIGFRVAFDPPLD
ncbi:formylglycine-generating enzyme family protein [Rhizobium cauense]|uniref:formylglycine-generating enzyme family protein n=1 Tax=Rhizobium cauense TaxID=1166683 RepID=UPI0030B89300